MASNTSVAIDPCPYPFLREDSYPFTGGYLNGRFCGPITPSAYCCLPCPLQQWVSSSSFERNATIAYWFNVPALVCQLFMLLTFAVLPKEVSGRHYLSIGLCVALMLLEISFIVPLGTNPDQCWDAVTPRDWKSSKSCAVSGVLLELGSMGSVVWIMLRSLWTHLRVVWDLQHSPIYIWLAHILGWGLPALFLAISLPITGVSFRVGGMCIPNPRGAFVTWFGWLIAFGTLGALVQLGTTGFCLAVYVKSVFRHERDVSVSTATAASHTAAATASDDSPTTTVASTAGAANPASKTVSAPALKKRLAWRRVHAVMLLQWRSILLSLFVILESIYFGTIYAAQVATQKNDSRPEHSAEIYRWTVCLIQTQGDKDKCMPLAKGLSVPEPTVITSFFMVSLIGIFTFLLMVRRGMCEGWAEVLRNPRRGRNDSTDEFGWAQPMRLSLGRILGSERNPGVKKLEGEGPTEVLPSPEKEVPEAGDVARRHETTNLFEGENWKEERQKVEGSAV